MLCILFNYETCTTIIFIFCTIYEVYVLCVVHFILVRKCMSHAYMYNTIFMFGITPLAIVLLILIKFILCIIIHIIPDIIT